MNTDQLAGTGLQVDGEVRQHFAAGAKWAKFISILMFIVCGILVLAGVAGSAALLNTFGRLGGLGSLTGMGTGLLILVIIICVAIFVVLFYFLFNFSSKIREALSTGNSATMNGALSSLRTYFVIAGILGGLTLLTTLYSLFQTFKYL